jgi:hypothetical protein
MIVLYRNTLLSSDAGDFLPMTQYKSFNFRYGTVKRYRISWCFTLSLLSFPFISLHHHIPLRLFVRLSLHPCSRTFSTTPQRNLHSSFVLVGLCLHLLTFFFFYWRVRSNLSLCFSSLSVSLIILSTQHFSPPLHVNFQLCWIHCSLILV